MAEIYDYVLLIVPYVYYLTYYLITLGLCNFVFFFGLLVTDHYSGNDQNMMNCV